MKYKKYLLVAAALVMIGAASIKPAMAYFTDTQLATGKITVQLGDSTIIPDEKVNGMTKIITVSNTGEYDVYVRVKAVYASNYTVTLTEESKASGWSEGDNGYFYYKDIVTKKGTDNSKSKELKLDIAVKDASIVSEDGFNVVIIQEATRVFYKENGSVEDANWEDKIIVETETSEKDDTSNDGGSSDTGSDSKDNDNNGGEGE